MKKLTRTIITLTLSILSSSFLSAADAVNFIRISIDEGLSQSTVFSIAQDHSGNMWFATYDGINKYNGYGFTVYQHDINDSTSLAEDITRVVCADLAGEIWIGTAAGLSYYDEDNDSFRNFTKNGLQAQVKAIFPLDERLLLVAYSDGLTVFDKEGFKFNDNVLPKILRSESIISVGAGAGSIFLGTEEGRIYRYDKESNTVLHLDGYKGKAAVQSLLIENDRFLWSGTEGDGLYRIDLQTKESRHFTQNNSSLPSNYVRALETDSSNQVWIGTFNNLCIYDGWKDKFSVYPSNTASPESLSQQSVRSIFRDNQGGMWLGTYFGGLNYYHPLKMRFKNIRRIPYINSLSGNIVSSIIEDRDGTIWIGTNEGGVSHYNPQTGIFGHYLRSTRKNGVESNDVKAIHIDYRLGKVYIGMHIGGLNVIDRNTGSVSHFNAENGPSDVYAIVPKDDRTLYIGSLEGLFLFDTGRETFRQVKSPDKNINSRIMAIFEDSYGRLWLGGDSGLQVFESGTDGADIGRCLSDETGLPAIKSVLDFHETSDNIIWIASRSGLYGFGRDSTIHLSTADGLPSNVIHGIEEDFSGNLWLSTNKGLSCYNRTSGNIKNYSAEDGLQSDQFNTYAHCRTASGKMYFGGINGITTFIPESLDDNPFAPAPIITGFALFDKEVKPGDHTGILSKSISKTEEITLGPAQNSFSLSFVVPNYVSGQHNTFAYILEGFDKKWNFPAAGIRTVSYSNLPAGKYTFKVKAANSDGLWNEEPAILEITLKPIWYKTWWALLLLVFFTIGLIWFIAHFIWERKSMSAKFNMEMKEKEAREEINQMKMRFFINISHELRTPLTLIVSPLHELLAKTTDKWAKTQLRFIERNTNRLLHLVNQLMDYRRAELGVFKLKVARWDAYDLVKENFTFYQKLAQHKGLTYNFVSDLEGRELLFDKKYLDLIVNNLISNAFKYTEKGNITVGLHLRDNNLVFEVSDTGVGIAMDKQTKIFERFFQIDGDRIGSGIGLSLVLRLAELHHGSVTVDSKEGEGSTFTVLLPQDESLYSDDEILKDKNASSENASYSTNPKELYYTDTEKVNTEDNTPEEANKGSVIVVEDNDEIRNYLKKSLKGNYVVKTAGNGEEALALLKDSPDTDLVITDVMMPVMDGIKLCRSIKQNIATSHIPVVMLSAKTDIEDKLEAYYTGADDYISKPFSIEELIAKVNNIIKTRKRAQDRYLKNVEVQPEILTFNSMDEDLIKKAIEIIRKNMDNEAFSTEDFAKEMNMSRSNLHLKMKAITGESALDFIRKIRFNEACALLKENKWTIAEISYKVGFSSPSYFSTSFKKYVGCLPTEYLKNGNSRSGSGQDV